ncbi:MmyB family transcriptional regulator [Nocardia rhamnosiphila]
MITGGRVPARRPERYTGRHGDDPQLTEPVGELSLHSGTFRRLWADHDVRTHTTGRICRRPGVRVFDAERWAPGRHVIAGPCLR